MTHLLFFLSVCCSRRQPNPGAVQQRPCAEVIGTGRGSNWRAGYRLEATVDLTSRGCEGAEGALLQDRSMQGTVCREMDGLEVTGEVLFTFPQNGGMLLGGQLGDAGLDAGLDVEK